MENDNRIEYELEPQTKSHMSQQKKGSLNPNYGKHDPRRNQKISDGQKKAWAKRKAFEDISKLALTRKVWDKYKYRGFEQHILKDCHDMAAMYQVVDLKSPEAPESFIIYYYFNDMIQTIKFEDMKDATSFFNSLLNPDLELLVHENNKKVTVLAMIKHGHNE